MTQIAGITDPSQIWNGTKVVNEFDHHLWILTNTQDTNPVIFEWTDQGITDIDKFSNGGGGYIIGKADVPGFVGATPEGYGQVNGWNDLPGSIFDILRPIGSSYTQRFNDPSPLDLGWKGTWEIWSGRADGYRLSDSLPPAYAVYEEDANYSEGDCVLWHMPGDDYRLYTAKAEITGAAAQLDPVLWDELRQGDIVERRLVQGWTDSDLAAGDQIAGGDYDGKYVTEVIVPGGKFSGVEGGNRPEFGGGAQGDRIRNITGSSDFQGDNDQGGRAALINEVGAIKRKSNNGHYVTDISNPYVYSDGISFDASRVVPTGPDNAPANLSVRLWRRTA
jgi:hypothetical protein